MESNLTNLFDGTGKAKVHMELVTARPKAASYARQLSNIDSKTSALLGVNGTAFSALLITAPLILKGLPDASWQKTSITLSLGVAFLALAAAFTYALRCIRLKDIKDIDVDIGETQEAIDRKLEGLRIEKVARSGAFKNAYTWTVIAAVILAFFTAFALVVISLS